MKKSNGIQDIFNKGGGPSKIRLQAILNDLNMLLKKEIILNRIVFQNMIHVIDPIYLVEKYNFDEMIMTPIIILIQTST